ncbi:hypothetical protein ACODYM_28925 [Burkholderia gladioli]|uniref:hypothetical protein n=1 Tax=Burkholderia gladioli TaxID=28095 RepID=UPI003B50B7D2
MEKSQEREEARQALEAADQRLAAERAAWSDYMSSYRTLIKSALDAGVPLEDATAQFGKGMEDHKQRFLVALKEVEKAQKIYYFLPSE